MATAKTYNSIDSKEQLMLVEKGKAKFGGYKQELLVSPLNEMEIEYYACTKCKGVMRNACQFGEEQIPVCEVCAGRKGSIIPMMKARKKIPELCVNCPLAIRGCKWNASLDNLDEHLDVCQEYAIGCRNNCGIILKRCELDEHCKRDCLKRNVKCKHCRTVTTFESLTQHNEICPKLPLLCPNHCGINLHRKQIESHVEKECPNTKFECSYKKFGCKQVVKRCEQEEHRKTNESKHLELTTLFAVNKIGELEEAIAQLKEEKADKKRLHELELGMEQAHDYQREMKAIIKRLSYPIVLRDVIKLELLGVLPSGTAGKKAPTWTTISYDMSWRSVNLSLLLKPGEKKWVSFWIALNPNKDVSSSIKALFEGRLKLTIIDNRFPSDSLVYESPVLKLQTGMSIEGDTTAQQEVKLTDITKDILSEERFKTEKKEVEFTLQVQDAEDMFITTHPFIPANKVTYSQVLRGSLEI